MPTNEYVLPLDKIKLNANKTHGKYIALNLVPNQKLTITSLFSWHQIYNTDKINGSIKSWKELFFNHNFHLKNSFFSIFSKWSIKSMAYRQTEEQSDDNAASPIE